MIKSQQQLSSQLVSQVKGNIVSDMDGEKVMLSIQNGKYYNMGKIGGEIWSIIEEPISVSNLITSLMSSYDVEPNECVEQVLSFLNQLLGEDLIVIEEIAS